MTFIERHVCLGHLLVHELLDPRPPYLPAGRSDGSSEEGYKAVAVLHRH